MGSVSGRLKKQGAFVYLTVMATHHRVQTLKAAGLPYPSPQTVLSLVDTGASCSAVDFNLLTQLSISPTGSVPVHTPSSGPDLEYRDVFDVSLTLCASDLAPLTTTAAAIGAHLAGQGFFAIVGWDILSQCVFRCDGPKRFFHLEY